MIKVKKLDKNIIAITEFYGIFNQLDQTIEECSELILETSKIKRYLKEHQGHTPDENWKNHIIEEMADVLVMIKQLMYLFDCKKEVQSMMKYKVDRQIKRIQLEVEEDNKK
ncbi:MAG: hypothetical protein HFE57_08395 [Firmicutes bacterium]|jgi:regulator of replication initiation timing|nr:hypothetical protein [Bacillota bacterium]